MTHTDIYDQVSGMACRRDCEPMEPRGQGKYADLARRGFLCNAIASSRERSRRGN